MSAQRADVESIRGSPPLREQFLESHRDFVRRYASFVCRRALDWRNDDELSVALIAFNDAIDRFDPSRHRDFMGFARMLVRRRLIDHFRKVAATRSECPLSDVLDVEDARDEVERLDRAFEMQHFEERMAGFGITLRDLVVGSPVHRMTREGLKRVAEVVSRRRDLVERLNATGFLPVREIQLAAGCSRRVLETWRKYLISLIVILSDDELEA
ncbi:MAG: hypothetical protein NUV93_09615, partial [Firmicutes bacterium]|nr:hypothetical protein [Bacillota bacterium]